jgi:ankyrin repeat protein
MDKLSHMMDLAMQEPNGDEISANDPLHWFAAKNDIAGLETLNVTADNVDDLAGYDTTAFLIATSFGSWEAAEWLLDHGADINATDEDGSCALSDAIEEEDVARLEWLLSRGADPSLNLGNLDPLFLAIEAGRPDMVRLLLKHGADPNPRIKCDGPSTTPLALARKLARSYMRSRMAHGEPAAKSDIVKCVRVLEEAIRGKK